MKGQQRKTALVTGASSGIGREIAVLLAEKGYDLILVSRNEVVLTKLAGELEHMHGITAAVFCSDLAKPGSAVEIYEECRNRGVAVDVLVNNAGLGHYGEVVTMPADRIEHLLTLNVTALTILCRLLGADMCQRGSGWILNVSSIVAAAHYPWFAVYAASKRYVTGFSKALREELKPCGVTVTCLHPGQTRTGFFNAAGGRKVNEAMLMEPSEVARAGLDAMFKGKSQVTPGLLNRIMTIILPIVPPRFVGRAMKNMIYGK